jgi:hypothetical protein
VNTTKKNASSQLHQGHESGRRKKNAFFLIKTSGVDVVFVKTFSTEKMEKHIHS